MSVRRKVSGIRDHSDREVEPGDAKVLAADQVGRDQRDDEQRGQPDEEPLLSIHAQSSYRAALRAVNAGVRAVP
jgi:hypothetical protein